MRVYAYVFVTRVCTPSICVCDLALLAQAQFSVPLGVCDTVLQRWIDSDSGNIKTPAYPRLRVAPDIKRMNLSFKRLTFSINLSCITLKHTSKHIVLMPLSLDTDKLDLFRTLICFIFDGSGSE